MILRDFNFGAIIILSFNLQPLQDTSLECLSVPSGEAERPTAEITPDPKIPVRYLRSKRALSPTFPKS